MKQAKQSETHPCHLMQKLRREVPYILLQILLWTCETYSYGPCIIELFVKQLEPRSYIDT
jgi:pyruvate carboxylase